MENNLSNTYSDEPRQSGSVKWFDEQKGYGFIRREDGSDLFVHFSSINREPQTINENDRVEFTVVSTDKGPQAQDVIVLAEAL
jgi:CspA family cold shock protein